MIALATGFLTFAGGALRAESVSFRQGSTYTGCVDTYLQIDFPGTSVGSDPDIAIDFDPENHGLIRFDGVFGSGPGQIPIGAIIVSAKLTVIVPNQGGISTRLHRMLMPFGASDTWNSWIDGVQADDVEAEATLCSTILSTLAPAIEMDVANCLQAWSDGQANHGLALLPDGPSADGWEFDSCDFPTETSRPLLEVEFVQPGVPAVSTWGLAILGLLVLTAGTVGILRRNRAAV